MAGTRTAAAKQIGFSLSTESTPPFAAIACRLACSYGYDRLAFLHAPHSGPWGKERAGRGGAEDKARIISAMTNIVYPVVDSVYGGSSDTDLSFLFFSFLLSFLLLLPSSPRRYRSCVSVAYPRVDLSFCSLSLPRTRHPWSLSMSFLLGRSPLILLRKEFSYTITIGCSPIRQTARYPAAARSSSGEAIYIVTRA